MVRRNVVLMSALTILIAAVWLLPAAGQQASPAAATKAKSWTPSRTPWGDPDLQGTYTNKADNNTPFERPREYGERQFLTEEEFAKRYELVKTTTTGTADDPKARGNDTLRDRLRGTTDWHEKGAPSRRTSLVIDPPDGRIPPLTPEAQKRGAGQPQSGGEADLDNRRSDSWLDRSLFERCITRGLPDAMLPGFYGHYYQILQVPGYVVIRYEMVHETRMIPVGGRPHLTSSVRQYMGDSRGHWEGNTLVVEVTNFPNKANFRGSTEKLRLIERFTPVDAHTVNWEVTVEDPATWTRPWKLTTDLSSDDDVAVTAQGPFERVIYDYECHEGNYGMLNLLSAARNLEKQKKE